MKVFQGATAQNFYFAPTINSGTFISKVPWIVPSDIVSFFLNDAVKFKSDRDKIFRGGNL